MQKLIRVITTDDITNLNNELKTGFIVVGTYPTVDSNGTTKGFDYLIEKTEN